MGNQKLDLQILTDLFSPGQRYPEALAASPIGQRSPFSSDRSSPAFTFVKLRSLSSFEV